MLLTDDLKKREREREAWEESLISSFSALLSFACESVSLGSRLASWSNCPEIAAWVMGRHQHPADFITSTYSPSGLPARQIYLSYFKAILVAKDSLIPILCYKKKEDTFLKEIRSRSGECGEHSTHLYRLQAVKTQRMEVRFSCVVHKD